MKPKKVKLNRDVTKKECDWLDKDIPAYTTLWTFPDFYGCSSGGVTVSYGYLEYPYFEVPKDAITEIPNTRSPIPEFSNN